ncbi:MAG TPA: CarD family transcriptional regulator [Candidatus Eisenbergiella merdigallinarum]|uniref:CarD family transcriptional regulator n=1 Tax=Candidatus Eisenbergiella merdigallinarum TaxID=2838552 RepID=A0A9D2MSD1_9FIRM|nr:CarD family transcriptional regulator [Candidatus Eisenbergiella merdigallinarum]
MYRKGDYVIYGCKGVCQIREVTTLNMEGIPKDRLYYEMQLVSDPGSTIFTPVEHEGSRSVMRPLLSEDEARDLLRKIPELEEEWIRDDRAREAHYRDAVNHGDAEAMLSLIRQLQLRRRARIEQGKKLPVMDSRYLKTAQDNLFQEFSIVLDASREKVESYVAERIRQSAEQKKKNPV